jgi:WD40 repeat protein
MLWDLGAGEATWAMKCVHKGHVTALAWADPAGGNDAWAGCFASGGQDGRLRLWDPRAHRNPAKLELHTNEAGKGAVTGILLGARLVKRSLMEPLQREWLAGHGDSLHACAAGHVTNVCSTKHLAHADTIGAATQTRSACAGSAAASYMAATCGADGTVRLLDARSTMGELAAIELTDFPYSFTAAGGLVLAGCGDGSLHVIDMATLQAQYALGANAAAVRTVDAARDKLVCSGDDGKALVYDFIG